MLSNLDLVTLSLTLMNGQMSFPYFSSLYNLATPVVVYYETPLRFLVSLVKAFLSFYKHLLIVT